MNTRSRRERERERAPKPKRRKKVEDTPHVKTLFTVPLMKTKKYFNLFH